MTERGVFSRRVAQFCQEYEIPGGAEEALQACLRLLEEKDALSLLAEPAERYEREDGAFPFRAELTRVTEQAGALGADPYTAAMLFSVLLVPRGKELYRRQGVDEQIIHDSFADLKWKMWECRKMYGIWGIFVAWWFDRWFDASRYAIGRLQYELCPLGEFPGAEKVIAENPALTAQTQVVNVHIPSSGHMPYEAVRASYEAAAAFFAERCGQVIFACESWLLYPGNLEFLPEKSNIRPFMADYQLFWEENTGEEGNLWRLFYVPVETPCRDLPETEGLQRAMKAWLLRGNAPGAAAGLFFWSE